MPETHDQRITRLCNEGRERLAEACQKFREANWQRDPDEDMVLTINEQLAFAYLRSQLRTFEFALNELHYSEQG